MEASNDDGRHLLIYWQKIILQYCLYNGINNHFVISKYNSMVCLRLYIILPSWISLKFLFFTFGIVTTKTKFLLPTCSCMKDLVESLAL